MGELINLKVACQGLDKNLYSEQMNSHTGIIAKPTSVYFSIERLV